MTGYAQVQAGEQGGFPRCRAPHLQGAVEVARVAQVLEPRAELRQVHQVAVVLPQLLTHWGLLRGR